MQATASARTLRSAALIVLVSGMVSGAVALGAWHLLPYESLDAETPAQRFAAWEGVMWALGLAGSLFGVAALFDATDLYGMRTVEHVHQQVNDARRGLRQYSEFPVFPWMLASCGAAMLLAAVLARGAMHP